MMPMHCKICQRDFEEVPNRKVPNAQRGLCSECLLLCRRQRQINGPEKMILHILHQYLVNQGVVDEKCFVHWKAMPNLVAHPMPKFWSESIFGDFLECTYWVTYIDGGSKEEVANFARKIRAAFASHEHENNNCFRFSTGHLFFRVVSIVEEKRPENNLSVKQFCAKVSICPAN